jgi:hypothetical protein
MAEMVTESEGATPTLEVNTLPWVEKYRPSSLTDLLAHEEITTILNKLIESNSLPHLLFYGPPGTGKTSTIIACAKQMYGQHFSSMTLELNASDERGIDVVRDRIKEFAGTKKLFSSGTKVRNFERPSSLSDASAPSDALFVCLLVSYPWPKKHSYATTATQIHSNLIRFTLLHFSRSWSFLTRQTT